MNTYKWFFLMLVAGIVAGCQKDSEAELVGDWQSRATFEGSGRSHCATFVIGNKGYVVGGTNGTSVLRNEVYEYDHIANAWKSDLRPFPGIARQQAVGFSLNGKGYVGTGWGWIGSGKEAELQTLRDFWKYDPTNDAWIEVAPLPKEAKIRRGAIAFSLQVNNKWYGFVGCGYTDVPDKEYLLDFWQFNPDGTTVDDNGDSWEGAWTKVYGYSGKKRLGAAVFVLDNKAYICNGENPSSVFEFLRFDPNASESEKWIKLRTMADANKDEDYDDDYGTLARAFGVAYVVNVDGQLRGHIVGGNKNGSANWEYDHREDLWVQRTSFINNQSNKSSREGMISFSFPETGRAFVGLGRATPAYNDDLWEFIPLIDDDVYSDIYQ